MAGKCVFCYSTTAAQQGLAPRSFMELWLNQILEKNKHLKKQNKKKIINIQWCKCDRQQVIDPLHEEEREVIKKGAEPAEGVVRETKGQKRGWAD